MPKDRVITYRYTIDASKLEDVLGFIRRRIIKEQESEKKTADLKKIDTIMPQEGNSTELLNVINFIKSQSLETNTGKQLIKRYAVQKTAIALPLELTSQYGYESDPLTPNEAKDWYKTFPSKITSDTKSTIFLAALIAEPARWSVSHITNMLLLDKRSNLNDGSESPEKQMTAKEQAKKDSGAYKTSGIYEHTSMTQSGSDPYGDTAKKAVKKGDYSKDKDIETDAPNLIKNVTDRDLAAVKRNQTLVNQLEKYYKQNSQEDELAIINEFVSRIKAYLNISS